MRGETCSVCGFDSELWSEEDVAQTIGRVDRLIESVLAGSSVPVRTAGERLGPVVVDDDDPVSTVHAVMHRLFDLAELRRRHEVLEVDRGVVDSVHSSTGGVPKSTVDHVEVGPGGIVGDAQADRIHHGRPWQAVCLYSSERLEGLRAEGHRIDAGCAGENVTLSGVDWGRLRGGLTISIGTVVLRTSMTVTPCYKIGGFFVDREFNRIHAERHPGWARWYASVLHGGAIRPGDTVAVTA